MSSNNAIRTAVRTALYAGVKKGANEMRKFISDNRVNRLVLLSDGLANVGPQFLGGENLGAASPRHDPAFYFKKMIGGE